MADIVEQLQATLNDRYRIERELGRGGMGIVFLATDLKHGRQVALKVLRPELAQSLGGERFLREIRISARLNHPHILTLIDSGRADGVMFYVLPFVEGESLRDRLNRERQLPVDEALRIARELADALEYAHAQGIVHRDIKPENILLEAGHAVLADFGVAHAVNEAAGEALTRSGLALGTPSYMSPEQATAAGRADARNDIYSLACVLYEMLAGTPPYTGPTPQAILARQALEAVPGLRVVRETVPPAVESAIVRALARVPADRYASAGEFARALAQPGPPPGARPGRVPLLYRALAIAAGSIVVLAAAAYVLWTRAGSHAPEAAVVHATFARLTADPGVEWFPSLSPHGRWVVYSGEASGNRDIYLQGVGGENAIDLTPDSPANDDQPAFSPDGERIAFRSEREGGGIFVMGRTGEAVRRVTRMGYRPSWSPDGTQIAFSTENVDLNPQDATTRGRLRVVNVASGAIRAVTDADAAMPSWSPHGQRIAFLHRLQTAGGHVWTVSAMGGEATPATTGAGRDWSPAWSADGTYLYYMSDRGGSMNLWRVRIDERSGRPLAEPEAVTAPGTLLGHVSVSADGRHIAYSSILLTANVQRSAFDPIRGVMVGEPRWVTHGSRVWSNPDPSPDGRQVAFYSLKQPEGELYVMRADGVGAPRQVADSSAAVHVPRWSPDGRWIAFFSYRSGPLQIWKIRPDGSGLTQLTDAAGGVVYSVWSPDGKEMAGASSVRAVRRTVLFDPGRPWGEQRPGVLPTPPDSLAPFDPHSWSPDGRRLAGMIATFDRGVVVYDFDTRKYQRLTDFGQWPVWLPDSRHLLFVSGGKAFYVVDRKTRAVRKVFSVDRDVIAPPQLTRDGHMVYYTRRVTEADIWILTMH